MTRVSADHGPAGKPPAAGGLPATGGFSGPTGGLSGPASDREARNTAGIELYQVVVRVGWLFKTETIIMPAVLDTVVDSGLLRGLLPVLNRGGQSLPPLFAAGLVARQPVKKWLLVGTSLAMAGCFGVLAAVWGPLESQPAILTVVFLALYGTFAAWNGLNQLVAATLQGKLIPPGHRGRAMLVSTVVGSVLSVAAALLLLRPWLKSPDGFPLIFGATAVFFALAAAVPILLDEPPDAAGDHRSTPGGAACGPERIRWRHVLASDRALVRVSLVAACFSAVIIMFPHYQAFARDRLGTLPESLVTWVVVQNIATGMASIVAGPWADRRGTKVVLVGLMACSALTPLTVTALSLLPTDLAGRWFWLVYVPLGLNPVSLKVFTNYALELAPRQADHAAYVSIVGAALAAPFVASPLVGLAVDLVGFRAVFLAGALVIAAGAIIARGLPEPRRG